jgi:hypothetical protein
MENKLQIGAIVKAPCGNNYSRFAYAEVERVGEQSCTVRALFGFPWTEFSHGGYCPTNRRNIYIENLDANLRKEDKDFLKSKGVLK